MDISLEKKNLCYRRMVDVLLGEGIYADVVIRGGYVINVVTREIYKSDVALKQEYILLVGDCDDLIGSKTLIYDATNKFVSPGFIDSHMHFESSMLTCTEFTRLSLASGTTTLFADPHEIGNVLGVTGIKAMIEEARQLPNRILFTVPALTPDVPGLETPGEEIDSRYITELLKNPMIQGIGEMQGFSNVRPVYENSPELIDELLTSVYYAQQNHSTVEGNAPSLSAKELAAHIIVCGGETSCHETTTKEECIEKLRNGMTVFMREGSTQKNMAECIKAVTEEGLDSRKLVLVTDDMVAEDLLKTGHMNEVIRKTIQQGLDPVEAIQMATINAAVHYGRKDIGILAPGKVADVCIIDRLDTMRVSAVFANGKLVAENGKLVVELPSYCYPQTVKHSMKCKKVTTDKIAIKSINASEKIRAIQVIENQNLTGCAEDVLPVREGFIEPDTKRDILPLVSIERHGKSDRIGKTFIKGMGLKYGAIAISVAHDTHNLLVCGTDYSDMAIAANRVMAMNGGIALVKENKVLGDLPLMIAGLMSDELTAHGMGKRLEELHRLAREELKCSIHSPFMHLSFVSLVTSPKWKISDFGLVDAEKYEILSSVE